MNTRIEWRPVASEHDPVFDDTRLLYSIFSPAEECLYFGKADGSTLYDRYVAPDKMRFWRELGRKRGIYHHCLFAGIPLLPFGCRLTYQLLSISRASSSSA